MSTLGNDTLAAALKLASHGIPVFPCKSTPGVKATDKAPYIENGFKAASTDGGQIAYWWKRWPDALIGVPTGETSGIFAIDVDSARHPEANDWLERYSPSLPDTRVHSTRSGGWHLLFKHREDLRNTTGKLAVGVDTRGEGGYIIWWAHHVGPNAPHRLGKILDLPDELYEQLTKPPISERATVHRVDLGNDDRTDMQLARAALESINADDRDTWVQCGMALENRFGEAGRPLWDEWSSTSAKYDERDQDKNWKSFGRGSGVTIGTLFHYAEQAGWRGNGRARSLNGGGNGHQQSAAPVEAPHQDSPSQTARTPNGKAEESQTGKTGRVGDAQPEAGLLLEDFYAYMEQHSYIYAPIRAMWPASSVNARFGDVALVDSAGKPKLNKKGEQDTISASKWLDQNRPVEQMTWAPGLPMLVRDRLVSHGGWINKPGVSCFNLYLPPTIARGNAAEADRWLDHIHKIYPNDADHIVRWLAQRVQKPEVKINHALVLGGPQGIGKDTLLEPVKYAVGSWNFVEASPTQILGRFNGFLKSVVLRLSEARDLGDVNRFQFYDHMKAYTAAPPDVLRVDEKNLREHSVFNVCGIIITSNHKSDGVYLPADDRRHYVAWSDLTKDDFSKDYWNSLWGWYARGGIRHIAAYLAELDISSFDAKAPPPKTTAFWAIVDANRAPEDAELADVVDGLGNPKATTIAEITAKASGSFAEWILDRRNRRAIPHRLEACGYVQVRNDDAPTDGLWKLHGRRQAIYARAELSIRDRIEAARGLVGERP